MQQAHDDAINSDKSNLLSEIAALREQLKDCSAAFDRQQEQLDRNAEQLAALREQSKAQLEELHRISDALGTNEGHSSVTHIETLKNENAALRESLNGIRAWLTDDILGGWPYMEGEGFYSDLHKWVAAIDAAMKEERK